MNKENKLGMGLGALLSTKNNNIENNNGIQKINISQIIPNPSQPRKKFKDEDIKDKSVPTTVNGKKAFEVIETQPGNQYAKGTWWQAFNAVTFNTDHQQGSTTDGRLTSAWYGRNRRVKLKALDTALKMAETV